MIYPIVKVKTPDNLSLFGLLAEANSTKTILINIHGTASAFYVEEFEEEFVKTLPEKDISVLFTNNRGNFIMESWQKTGAALEKFEDCLIDIDTWVEFVLKKGYKQIFLQGHSLGSEKVVYYMEKGKYKDKISGVILLGFTDSYGVQMKFLKTLNVDPAVEARRLINENKGEQFIDTLWLSHAGVLPQSAESYLNFFSPDSELSKALPLRQGKDLKYFRNIKVPILAITTDPDPWAVVPLHESADLLRKENGLAKVEILSGTNHSFEGKQKEVVQLVNNFVLKTHS